MEIEAKYQVNADDLAFIATLRQLGSYQLTPAPAPEHQQNTYYDTADGRLATARYGLRVRHIGTHALITLKGPTAVGPDSIHRRAEFEFPGDAPDPATWPPGEARELALALTGGAPLVPTVTIMTERQIVYASQEGRAVAELCLDQGVMRAGPHERPFTELEIELLPAGSRNDLTVLITELSAKITLPPQPRTKLQRAMDLRHGHEA